MPDEQSPRRGSWPFAAVVGVAAVIGAFLTWAVSAGDQLPGGVEGMLRLTAAWLVWTMLLAAALQIGILRMTALNRGDESDVSPRRALVALVTVIVIVLLAALQALLLDGFGGRWVLYGSLVLCIAAALAIVHVRRRRP